MTDVLIDAEADESGPVVAPARPGTLRRLFARRRSDRKGALGSTEMIQLIGVILLIAILAGGTFVYLRYIRASTEHSVLQRNIDEVAKLGDSYWQSYAADSDGRRKINLGDFCHFANNQLAEDDLNLRTLQLADNTTATSISNDPAGDFADVALSIANYAASDETEAACLPRDWATDLTDASQEEMYADIIAYSDAVATAHTIGTGTNVPTPAVAHTYISNATTPELRAAALDAAGLHSTGTVWMAVYGTGAAIANFAPGGTDTTFAPQNMSNFQRGVEYLVFGGMTPDGASFCLIKVFDASDADEIGEYRVSRLPQTEEQFTVCAEGVNSVGVSQDGWPEPQ